MDSGEREIHQRRVGTVLKGKWTLERLVGWGGMAAVYAARHRVGNEVAIKIVNPEIARSPELRMRFEQEARVMAQLEHPGAVRVMDVDETEDGAPFMVMELLEGEPLSERMRRSDVPLDEALRATDELLDVLADAHGRGIIHRDIKLDNVFITKDGSVKVLDFGIARVRDAIALTMVGARLGTLPYMPPEQVRATGVDARADLFAVGAVMFRLLAKRRIHEVPTEQELLVRMSTEPAPGLASVAPSAAPGVCLIVDRALAFDRDRRYPDARTMQGDVQALRRGQEPPYAARQLREHGPPNPPSTAAPGAARGGKTMATRAASPSAKVSVGAAAGPLSATGVATPAMIAAAAAAVDAHGPASAATAVAPAAGPLTAAATPFDASPAPLAAKTQMMASAAAATAQHTMVSPGALASSYPTMMSANGGGAAILVASAESASGAFGGAPLSSPVGALPVQVAPSAAKPAEDQRQKLVLVIAIASAAAGLLFLVLYALLGDGDDVGAESPGGSETSSEARAATPEGSSDLGQSTRSQEADIEAQTGTPAIGGTSRAPAPGAPPRGATGGEPAPRPTPSPRVSSPSLPSPAQPATQAAGVPAPPVKPNPGRGKGHDKDKKKKDDDDD